MVARSLLTVVVLIACFWPTSFIVLNSLQGDDEALLAKALAMSIGVGEEEEEDSNSDHNVNNSSVNVSAPTSGAFGNPAGMLLVEIGDQVQKVITFNGF